MEQLPYDEARKASIHTPWKEYEIQKEKKKSKLGN